MTPSDFEKVFRQATVDGVPMPIGLPISRSALGFAFAAAGFTRGAEVGVWEGGFASQLCAPNPNLELICVDPWSVVKGYEENKNDAVRMARALALATERLAPYNCHFMQMTSAKAAPQIPDGSLDFVYIDGNHLFDHVLRDITLWLPKVRSGGVIAGHDYTNKKQNSFIQVRQAVDQFTREHAIDPWFILTGDKSASWLWVVR